MAACDILLRPRFVARFLAALAPVQTLHSICGPMSPFPTACGGMGTGIVKDKSSRSLRSDDHV